MNAIAQAHTMGIAMILQIVHQMAIPICRQCFFQIASQITLAIAFTIILEQHDLPLTKLVY